VSIWVIIWDYSVGGCLQEKFQTCGIA